MPVPVKTDYAFEAGRFVREAHRSKPRTLAILQAGVSSIQELEFVFQSLSGPYDIEAASGARLDSIGTLLGVQRFGLDDASYRLLLFGSVAASKSSGLLQDVLVVAQKLFQCTVVVPYAPASAGMGAAARGGGIGLMLGSPQLPERLYSLARKLLLQCLPAGVRLDFLGQFNASKAFSFAGARTYVGGFGSTKDASKGAPFGGLRKLTPRSA